MMKKKNRERQKMMIFHPVLAPYRIDQFNMLNDLFDLEVVFLFDSLWNFSIDQKRLTEACNFKISYLLTGPRYKGRLFRFGILCAINRAKPDIIFGYEYSFTTQYLILLKRMGFIKEKVGSFIDDSLKVCENVQSKARKWARSYSLKHLDYLVVMSDEVARFYYSRFNISENQIVVSPILQLSERLRNNKETIEELAMKYIEEYKLYGNKVALYVGRFIPEKGLSIFLNKISHIVKDNDNYKFVLIGEGLEKEKLTALVKDHRLEDKIIFPGMFQADELYGWYACASGFVLPSLFEPFGAVVNEALIFGIPVLCSQFAGSSTLIQQSNGYLFNPLDYSDSISKFSLFMDKIPVVEKINLNNTPPLIEDHRSIFNKEWRKVSYE